MVPLPPPFTDGLTGGYVLTKILLKDTEWPVCSMVWNKLVCVCGCILTMPTAHQPGLPQMSGGLRHAPLSELHASPTAGLWPPPPPLGGAQAGGSSWQLSSPPPVSNAGSSVGCVAMVLQDQRVCSREGAAKAQGRQGACPRSHHKVGATVTKVLAFLGSLPLGSVRIYSPLHPSIQS